MGFDGSNGAILTFGIGLAGVGRRGYASVLTLQLYLGMFFRDQSIKTIDKIEYLCYNGCISLAEVPFVVGL